MLAMRDFRCSNLVRYFDGAVIAQQREAFIVRFFGAEFDFLSGDSAYI